MPQIDLQTLLQWQGFAAQAIALGVRSWAVIRAAMTDAGADDATIAALQPKWDALVDDIRRAAQP